MKQRPHVVPSSHSATSVRPTGSPATARRRILFVAEALTLCHVSRPLVLGRALEADPYEVHFACSEEYHPLFQGVAGHLHAIRSVPSRESLARVARGRPVFSTETLRGYVQQDLRLLEDVKPDLVVGDMRLSLAVSAPLAGVPYMAIVNAYWSPYARQRFDVPELPITRVLGPRIVGAVFPMLRPLAFAQHCRPLNRVRREYGLPSLGNDLRRVYTHADYTLYADAPELVPTIDAPAHHHYLGPILWSFPASLPAWWNELPDDRPVVFVSLGSSGRANLLQVVLDALADHPVTVIAGTSGRTAPKRVPPNAFLADYLSGIEAAARADLLVSHGGSAPAYVALSQGTPVLGMPSNLDQQLTVDYVERAGAGLCLRAEYANRARVARAVTEMLENPSFCDAARNLSHVFSRYHAPDRFRELLARTCGRPQAILHALSSE